MNLKDEVAMLVRSIKVKRNMNQREIASAIGYTETYLSDVLSGRVAVTQKFLNKLRQEFHAEVTGNNHDTLNARLAQLQAMYTSLEQDYIETVAKLSGEDQSEIRSRLVYRAMQNLSKLINP